MDHIVTYSIIRALKLVGFDMANKKALCLFVEYFKVYVNRKLGGIKRISTHSQRSKTTLIDFVKNFGILDVVSFEKMDFCVKREETHASFYGPISAPVEKFINVYEFMPTFPPLHTFRYTLVKENKVRSKARDIKERIEQKNQVSTNLFRLLKKSNALPNYANYLY